MTLPTKLTHDGAATVAPSVPWISLQHTQPSIGSKVLVIDKAQGIAYLRAYQPRQGWTHWHPLPVFHSDDNS